MSGDLNVRIEWLLDLYDVDEQEMLLVTLSERVGRNVLPGCGVEREVGHVDFK